MKSAAELLHYFYRLDVKVWADGDVLRYDAPGGKMTPVLLDELRERKVELLHYLHHANADPDAIMAPIPPVPRDAPLPLSFAQQRLWILDRLDPGNPAYNLPAAVRLKGALDSRVLEQSINEVIRRHEALRTSFGDFEGQPIQVIAPALILSLPIIHIQEMPLMQREAEAQRLAREESQRTFKLTEGPLLRMRLLRMDEKEHVLLIIPHHIVFDGWSVRVLIREVAALYTAFIKGKPSPLPNLPIQYADYAVWQRQRVQGELLDRELFYWRQQLTGITALELMTDRPRPAVQTSGGARAPMDFPPILVKGLKELSQKEGVTLFMTLLAVLQVLLYRYTGQEDITVGTPVANRQRVDTESLIGFFVNTLVLRTNLEGNPTFREILGRVRPMVLQAQAHQELPFERLVEELRLERDLSRTPLFQTAFSMQSLQSMPTGSLQVPGLTMSSWSVDSGTAQFDLTLFVTETEQSLTASLVYNTDLFDAGTIARLAGHFRTLLEGIVATQESPGQRLSSLPLLTEAEQHQLLVEWNNTRVAYPKDRCIHELFEAQVERTPDAVAVVFENQNLTFQKLNQQANQLAHHLRELSIGAGACVGVCMERTPAMIIALYGILKAGGAYVPLDPAYPDARLAFMMADARMAAVLVGAGAQDRFPQRDVMMICPDKEYEKIAHQSEANLLQRVFPDELAYLIYTSGSTGTPKGVAIAHHNTTVFIQWAQTVYTEEDLTGVLVATSICFDISVFELFAALCCGGRCILAENVLRLPLLPDVGQVVLLNTVPSALAELIRNHSLPPAVRIVNLAGEPLPGKLVQEAYRNCNVQKVFNLYGPSEDTTYSTFTLIPKNDNKAPCIGRPIANSQVYLLNDNLLFMPIGFPGELCIGGDGLARGYLGRPALNAEKFIPNPFCGRPGARLYRTGDLARYRPNGDIEFLGRLDHQVKIRGFRIELGEIEAALEEHPAVQEAVVVAREDKPHERCLIAYLVIKQKPDPASSELNRFLKKKLPQYMLPSAFMVLKALPLTPNGKVDRRALPPPDQNRLQLEVEFVAPRTAVEEVIAGVWKDILKLERVGVFDNFFDLGGHSLLAIQIISRMLEFFRDALPKETIKIEDALVHAFFEISTIAGLAEALQNVGDPIIIEKTAQVLLKLAQLSDDQVAEMLSNKARQPHPEE